MSEQQLSFASNVSHLELKLANLTNTLHDLLKELQQQQKPVEHVRRLMISKKEFDINDLPTGGFFFTEFKSPERSSLSCTDCDDVLRQQPDRTEPGVFRIKPRHSIGSVRRTVSFRRSNR